MVVMMMIVMIAVVVRLRTSILRRRRVVAVRGLKGILSEIFQWNGMKNLIKLEEGNVIVGPKGEAMTMESDQREAGIYIMGFWCWRKRPIFQYRRIA
jgi:hypothetical protein